MIIEIFKLFKIYLQNNKILKSFFNGYYLLKYPKDSAYPFILFDFQQQQRVVSIGNDVAMKMNVNLSVFSLDDDFEKMNKIYHELFLIFRSNILKTKNGSMEVIVKHLDSNIKAGGKSYIIDFKLKLVIFNYI